MSEEIVQLRTILTYTENSVGDFSETQTLQYRSRLTNISGNAAAIGSWGPWRNVDILTETEAESQLSGSVYTPTALQIALSRTQNARYYGRLISDTFMAKCLLNDIYGEVSGVDKVDDISSKLSHILDYLEKGAIPKAIYAIHTLPPASYDSTFITPPSMLEMLNQLEDLLGWPRSNHLLSGVI